MRLAGLAYGTLDLACVPQRVTEDAVELVVLRHGLAGDPLDLGQFPFRDHEVDALEEGQHVVEGPVLPPNQPHAHVPPQRHRHRLDGREHLDRSTPLAPRARAWSVLVLTRNLVWHRGQVTLKSAFFGTFPSWIASLVEQNVQMMSIGLLLLHRPGITRVQGQALDVGRLLAARLLDLVDAALHDRLSAGVQLGGLLRDQSLRIDFDDRLIEGLHAEGNAGFLDLVEGLPLALARQDGFAGPDIVAEDVVDGDTAPAHLGQQALADDPADRVREALADQFFLFLVEHPEDAVDGLARIHRVHRAQHEVAGLGRL